MTLTRAQLAALTALHRDGDAYPQVLGITPPAPRRATLDALVSAGLAKRDDPVDPLHYLPTVHTYADGAGWWRVVVPHTVDEADRAAVARAVITGEVDARDGGRRRESGYRIRVEAVETDDDRRRADRGNPTTTYREA